MMGELRTLCTILQNRIESVKSYLLSILPAIRPISRKVENICEGRIMYYLRISEFHSLLEFSGVDKFYT